MNNVELREKLFKIINAVLDNHSDSIKISMLESDNSIIIDIDPTHTVQIVPFDEIKDGYAFPMYDITFVNNNTKCNMYSSVSIEEEAYTDEINDILDKVSELNAKYEIEKIYKEFVKEEKK